MNDTLRPTPKRIGGYEILSRLRCDGGTHVYAARQIRLHRRVRLAVLPADEARKPAYRIRFERELKILSELRHPHILGAIEAGEIDGDRYVVTEDIAGLTVADALASGSKFGVVEAIGVARGVASALEHFEEAGFVHRSVTPSAIVLTEAGVAKLGDLSRAKGCDPASGETWFETEDAGVFYRAPESIRGAARIDVRADIYGLGCTLYQMLAGRPPFRGPAAVVLAAHLESPPRTMRRGRPEIPEAVEQVVLRCLRKSRADRYQHAAEVVRALDDLLRSEEVARLTSRRPED